METTNNKKSFAGITLGGELNKEIEKEFDCIDYDAEVFYVSKKMYHHDEDEYDFDYRYVLEVIDMREFDGANLIITCLYLVPCFKDWANGKFDDFLDFIGLDKEDVGDVNDDENLIKLYADTIGYGNTIFLGQDSFNIPTDCNEKYVGELEGAKIMILTALNCVELINCMRGFYLDRQVNRIGNIGWDMLDSVLNGTNWQEKGLERMRQMQEEYEQDK